MPENRNSSLGGIWAKNGVDLIGPPTQGVTYRNSILDLETVEAGWPHAQIVNSADINEYLHRLSTLAAELEKWGILPWNAMTNYAPAAVVLGSDGKIYQAINSSVGEDPAVDAANWMLFQSGDGSTGGSGSVVIPDWVVLSKQALTVPAHEFNFTDLNSEHTDYIIDFEMKHDVAYPGVWATSFYINDDLNSANYLSVSEAAVASDPPAGGSNANGYNIAGTCRITLVDGVVIFTIDSTTFSIEDMTNTPDPAEAMVQRNQYTKMYKLPVASISKIHITNGDYDKLYGVSSKVRLLARTDQVVGTGTSSMPDLKTVNGQSLLGTGNIIIQEATEDPYTMVNLYGGFTINRTVDPVNGDTFDVVSDDPDKYTVTRVAAGWYRVVLADPSPENPYELHVVWESYERGNIELGIRSQTANMFETLGPPYQGGEPTSPDGIHEEYGDDTVHYSFAARVIKVTNNGIRSESFAAPKMLFGRVRFTAAGATLISGAGFSATRTGNSTIRLDFDTPFVNHLPGDAVIEPITVVASAIRIPGFVGYSPLAVRAIIDRSTVNVMSCELKIYDQDGNVFEETAQAGDKAEINISIAGASV